MSIILMEMFIIMKFFASTQKEETNIFIDSLTKVYLISIISSQMRQQLIVVTTTQQFIYWHRDKTGNGTNIGSK